jgi:hypothetical protein
MSNELKITPELLYRGALTFALIDAVYISLLDSRVNEAAFRRLKWPLAVAAALVWFGIWSWTIDNFWETVYVYLFPHGWKDGCHRLPSQMQARSCLGFGHWRSASNGIRYSPFAC